MPEDQNEDRSAQQAQEARQSAAQRTELSVKSPARAAADPRRAEGLAGEALMSMIPYGKAASWMVRQMPRLAPWLLGSGMSTAPMEAGTGTLSQSDLRRRRQELAIEREKSRIEKDRIESSQKGEKERLEGERRATEQKLELDRRMSEEKRKLEDEEAKAKAEAPFRDRYPNLASALPLAGFAAAVAMPSVLKKLREPDLVKFEKDWEKLIDKADKTIGKFGPKSEEARQVYGELQAKQREWSKSAQRKLFSTMVGGGFMGAEGMVLAPLEYDAAMLPSGSPNQKAAASALYDPATWLGRVPAAGMAGAGLSGLGSKFAGGRIPPAASARTQGLLAAQPQAQKQGLQLDQLLGKPTPGPLAQVISQLPTAPSKAPKSRPGQKRPAAKRSGESKLPPGSPFPEIDTSDRPFGLPE